MRIRPIVVLSTALAVVGGSGLATAGAAAEPPVGSATSTVTLVDVGLGGSRLQLGELAVRSSTLGGRPRTTFVSTPLTVDGQPYGRQSASSHSGSLPVVDTSTLAPADVTAVVSVRSPLIDVRSGVGSTRAGVSSLGQISVLGMPVRLSGSAVISSSVDDAGAAGGKSLLVTDVAMPSIGDLLAASGLDLRSLPTTSLIDLLDRLDLGSTSSADARAALEEALRGVQPQVDAATSAVAEADAAIRGLEEQLAADTAALAPVTDALNDATRALTGASGSLRRGSLLGTGLDVPTVPSLPGSTVANPVAPALDDLIEDVIEDVVEEVQDALEPVVGPALPVPTTPLPLPPVDVLPLPTLPEVLPPALQPAVDAYEQARAAYDTAVNAVQTTQTQLTGALGSLGDARAALEALLAPFRALETAVVDAVLAVLEDTPLVSLDRIEVTTSSQVRSAAAGGQSASVERGEVQGLRVLGTDVLREATGRSRLDLRQLSGPVNRSIDDAVDGLTGTLADALSSVPGLPGLRVPAPTLRLLTSATTTDVVDGFGVAGSALRAVTLRWPALQIPAAAARTGAASLPAVAGLPTTPRLGAMRLMTAGDVVSRPITLSLVTLEDRARYNGLPGSVTAPGSDGTDGDPTTGAPGAGTPDGPGIPTAGTPGAGTPGTDGPEAGTPGDPTDGSTPPGTVSNPRIPPVALTSLPRTGLDSDPSLLALLLVATALGLHRRSRTT